MKDLSKIKLLVCDCDGVLTDGLITYDSQSAELKNFCAHDGLGFKLLSHSDIQTAIITGRDSKMLERRCSDLNIKYLYQNVHNKKRCLKELLEKLDISFDNVAYIGDDWNDYLAMQECYFKIAPQNSSDDFKITADYVTQRSGGSGAVREAIEYILKNRKEFEKILMLYFSELSNS